MAFWSIGVGLDPARGNPLRVVQTAAIYATASIVFVVDAGVVHYSGQIIAMLAGGVGGGYCGAQLARRLPTRALRATVITTGAAATILYFVDG